MAVDLKRSLRAFPIVRQAVERKAVVVAIDFGTTYSGYAFSFYSDFEDNPLKIHAPSWQKGKTVGIVHKTSTCALFTPKREFHSFGYDAEEKYSELANETKHHNWFYFRRFKMILYEKQDLSIRLEIRDDKGNSMPAMEVFAKSIEYLKDHFVEEFERTKDDHPATVEVKDIHWVLTVPAIWDDKAKQFMREAAINAGIHTDRLSIALEPEAASLFCRYIPVERVGGTSGSDFEIRSFGAGDKYLVLDAGGGTIDITVHEIQEDETVKELYVANGGEWGGTTIDKKFDELLNDIIGPDTMEIIALRHKDDHLDIMSGFEIKKRTITPESSTAVSMRIPLSVSKTYKELNGNQKLEALGKLQPDLRGKVTFDKDKLRVDADIMKGLYAETCEHIVNHMKPIFEEREVYDVRKILMVGGFSESKMLQDAMKTNFPDKIFIIPEETGLAVLKGAVTFGHSPTMVSSRVIRYTYGIKAIRDFQPGLDRPERRTTRKFNDTTYFLCENTFSVHATRGESFEVGESRGKHEYVPSEPGEKKLTVSVYRSTRRMPIYTDEAESEKVGDIDVPLLDKDNGMDRPVTVEMIFGNPELAVQIVEKKTGSTKDAKFDCLKRESYA